MTEGEPVLVETTTVSLNDLSIRIGIIFIIGLMILFVYFLLERTNKQLSTSFKTRILSRLHRRSGY